jgi:oxalate decarboxylase
MIFATLLTAISGFLDAAAFVELNRLYVSFMSGNSTHLGMALAAAALPQALAIGAIVIAFVTGAGVGTWIADSAPSHLPASVVGAEAAILVAALLLILWDQPHISLLLAALAMGMQNVLHQVIAGADVGKSFITGALFGLGQSMARMHRSPGATRQALSNLTSWSAFVAGAAAGAATLTALGLTFCMFAAVTLILALLGALLLKWL